MVKALTFKGDKKPSKKRKRTEGADPNAPANEDGSQQLVLTADAPPEDDDNWVCAESLTDIAGPVVLVLPTSPVTSVSVDQLGRVFAQEVENLVEGSPGTSEPHDVRQVWIANRVVGSEREFTFKGHHGRYLGASSIGVLSATREAVSQEETFRLSLTPPAASSNTPTFALSTTRSTFVSASTPTSLRADATEDDDSSTTRIIIRMQARFKPRHKVEKAEQRRAKISRKELEKEVGRRLEDDEVKTLKRARREGDFHEVMLGVKVKGKHDKYA